MVLLPTRPVRMVEILDWNGELGGESLNQSTWNRIRKDMNLDESNSRKAYSGRTIGLDFTHADLWLRSTSSTVARGTVQGPPQTAIILPRSRCV